MTLQSCALVVGINEYPASAGVNTLFGAVADAADFADWALHPNGGGILPDNLYFWTFPAPAAPSKELKNYLQSPRAWNGGPPNPARPPNFVDIVATAVDLAKKAPGDGI